MLHGDFSGQGWGRHRFELMTNDWDDLHRAAIVL